MAKQVDVALVENVLSEFFHIKHLVLIVTSYSHIRGVWLSGFCIPRQGVSTRVEITGSLHKKFYLVHKERKELIFESDNFDDRSHLKVLSFKLKTEIPFLKNLFKFTLKTKIKSQGRFADYQIDNLYGFITTNGESKWLKSSTKLTTSCFASGVRPPPGISGIPGIPGLKGPPDTNSSSETTPSSSSEKVSERAYPLVP